MSCQIVSIIKYIAAAPLPNLSFFGAGRSCRLSPATVVGFHGDVPPPRPVGARYMSCDKDILSDIYICQEEDAC